MSKLNMFSLKMKLKRHKISHQVLDNGKALQLGGAKFGLGYVVGNIIVPLVIGLILFALLLIGIIPSIRFFTALIIGIPFAYGGVNMYVMYKKKKSNKDVKIIENGKVTIISKGSESVFAKDDIFDITVFIEEQKKEDQDLLEGILYLVDNKKNRFQLLGIFDSERKYLTNDLNYFKDFFNMLVGR